MSGPTGQDHATQYLKDTKRFELESGGWAGFFGASFRPIERTLLPPLFLGCSERYLARSHQILLRGGSCRLRDDDDDDDDEGMPL